MRSSNYGMLDNIGRAVADQELRSSLKVSAAKLELNTALEKGADNAVEAVKIVLKHDFLIQEAFTTYEVIRCKKGECENSLAGLYGPSFVPEYLDGERFARIFNLLNEDESFALGYLRKELKDSISSIEQREMTVLVAVIYYIKTQYKTNLMQAQFAENSTLMEQIELAESAVVDASSENVSSHLHDLILYRRKEGVIRDAQTKSIEAEQNKIDEKLAEKGVILQLAVLLNAMSMRRYSSSNHEALSLVEKREVILKIINEIIHSEFQCDPSDLQKAYNPRNYLDDDVANTLSDAEKCLIMYVIVKLRETYEESVYVKAIGLLTIKQIQLALVARGDKKAEVFKPTSDDSMIESVVNARPDFPPLVSDESQEVEEPDNDGDEVMATHLMPELRDTKSSMKTSHKIIIAILVVFALAGLAVGIAASFGALGAGIAIVTGCAIGYTVAGSGALGSILLAIKSCFDGKKRMSADVNTFVDNSPLKGVHNSADLLREMPTGKKPGGDVFAEEVQSVQVLEGEADIKPVSKSKQHPSRGMRRSGGE